MVGAGSSQGLLEVLHYLSKPHRGLWGKAHRLEIRFSGGGFRNDGKRFSSGGLHQQSALILISAGGGWGGHGVAFEGEYRIPRQFGSSNDRGSSPYLEGPQIPEDSCSRRRFFSEYLPLATEQRPANQSKVGRRQFVPAVMQLLPCNVHGFSRGRMEPLGDTVGVRVRLDDHPALWGAGSTFYFKQMYPPGQGRSLL